MGLMDVTNYEKNTDAIGAGLSKMGVAHVAACLSVYTELFTVFDRGHRSVWGGLWHLVDGETHLSLPPRLSGWLRSSARAATYAE
jgi:hypothetical protein